MLFKLYTVSMGVILNLIWNRSFITLKCGSPQHIHLILLPATGLIPRRGSKFISRCKVYLRLATIAELKLGHSSPVIHRVDKLIFNEANSCRKVSDLVIWELSYTLKYSWEETHLCWRQACLKTQQPAGLTLLRSRSFHTYQWSAQRQSDSQMKHPQSSFSAQCLLMCKSREKLHIAVPPK